MRSVLLNVGEVSRLKYDTQPIGLMSFRREGIQKLIHCSWRFRTSDVSLSDPNPVFWNGDSVLWVFCHLFAGFIGTEPDNNKHARPVKMGIIRSVKIR